MTDILTGAEFDGNYKKWISEVSSSFKNSQIKAFIKVNCLVFIGFLNEIWSDLK